MAGNERLREDLNRVWVRLVPRAVARYVPMMETCELDERFVLAEATFPDLIAAAIVHAATHARLWRRGIGYDETLSARVKAACFRSELAFAATLPNADRVREQARAALAIPPATWTDTAERDCDVDGATEVLHHLGAPNWLVRALLAARAWRASRRATRRSSEARGPEEKAAIAVAAVAKNLVLRWDEVRAGQRSIRIAPGMKRSPSRCGVRTTQFAQPKEPRTVAED